VLARHKRARRVRDELAEGLRSFPVGDYVVVHRINSQDVQIAHVVRGSRDLGLILPA